MDAPAAGHDAAVEMIDTSVVRVQNSYYLGKALQRMPRLSDIPVSRSLPTSTLVRRQGD
jgi:hypothetical protein